MNERSDIPNHDPQSTQSRVSEGHTQDSFWNFHPPVPLKFAPYFDKPKRPLAILKHILAHWHPLSMPVWYLVLACIIYAYFTPSLERTATFSWDWIFEIWLRDMVLILSICGGSHLYLHTFESQANYTRYDKRDLERLSKRFLFQNQVWDNMFSTLTTGVACWVFWEALLLWSFANGIAPLIEISENPIWFVLLLGLIPWWTYFYFDLQHRLLHTKFLYKHVHYVHHKNKTTGPWSGLAMHPVEHFLLMSDSLVFFLVSSHPIHVIYDLLFHGIGAPLSHTGFERLRLHRRLEFRVGDFYHQLHHRFVDVNHGTLDTPFDKWFESWHDGTVESTKKMRARRSLQTH